MQMSEREILNARVGHLLHEFFIRIRAGTYPRNPGDVDHSAELNDLADLAHNLPRFIVGNDEHAVRSPKQLRDEVLAHVGKFYPELADSTQHRYLMLLDLDSNEFIARYCDQKWHSA